MKVSRVFRRAAGLLLPLVFSCHLALAAPPAATPMSPEAAAVKSGVEAWLKGRYRVDEVRRTPLAGIWEVRFGQDLIYVDGKSNYAFIDGNLIDLHNGRNLTRERIDQLLTIDFKELPLNLAVKQVNGNGKRVIAVFEDANCTYCKRMRAELVSVKDVTVYTFPIAILAPDSEIKAKKALCAPDQARAWNDLMLGNKIPANPGTCDNNLGKIKELADRLGIRATPTLFFSNGRRVQGYVPGSQFEQMLDQNSKS